MALTSQMKQKSGSDGGHHIPHEARGLWEEPGWPTLNYKEEGPSLETVAITSQMKRRVAVMVATTYPMKPGALGGEPGWPAPHEKEEEPCLETVAITSQMEKKRGSEGGSPHAP